ncbi:Flp family type IVb pilin [Paraburkholderia bengalensis]|uniref:Flp family type IVb pilin n=1 Tax=Paraburkholderia bengalensis TaxID=2747562 RepID=A0ABU8IMQ4_9BURK|nr:Flp family type IVb pilin [Paraburkholderia hospita]EUC14335.1 Flp/Fap pilin component [Burkholderia sp. BT03]SKC93625.1 pilus assembly protein Flp/PilA [Paraburkholderia hospita]
MQKTLDLIRAFAREEDGVTAIEYGLLASLVACGIIVAATGLGTQLSSTFNYISGKLLAANPA